MSSSNTEGWSSRVGLILAMVGNSVGLGSFLRFPVQAIQNGGGSFIIPYLVCFLLMGIPLLYVEWAMGRFGGKYGHHSAPFILDSMSKYGFWKYLGAFGIFTNLAVAAYYCYLESWTLGYIWHSVAGTFNGQTRDEVANFFTNYTSLSDNQPIIFWIICLVLNTWILSRGLKGIEQVAKISIPLLFLFGIILAIRGLTLQPGSSNVLYAGTDGLNHLWSLNFSTIWSPKVWLAAAAQVFFTLSVGIGSIQCYSAYLRSNDDVALNAMSAGSLSLFAAICLGTGIVIPISVGYFGVEGMLDLVAKGDSWGLGFRTLPFLFQQWGPSLAIAASVMWFGLLFFAGITSSLAMGTPCMAFMQDEFGWKRPHAAWAFGATVAVLGLPTVLYFNYGVFDEYDHWAGTVSLVIFAFVEIILFAWIFGMKKGWAEITRGADIKVPIIFRYIIQYVTPVILGWVLFSSMPANWDKIMNTGLHAQIAEATDPAVIDHLKKTILYQNTARIGLLAIWVGVASVVYVAYRKRMREGRFTH